MNAVTLEEARRDLERLIERAVDDAEPTIVRTESGRSAIFLSLDEFNAWRETAYLLASPANAQRLRASIGEAGAGLLDEHDLTDE